jgi:hypothetical protein
MRWLASKNLSYDGSLEIRGNSVSNEVDRGAPANDHRGDVATRVRVGINAEVTENVTGRLELIRTPRQYGKPVTNLNSEQDKLEVHNAYIDIANIMGEGHNLRIGRQYVGNPGDLVWNISPTDDDSLTANSIDGILFQCRTWDFLQTDLFIGKAVEVSTMTSLSQGDTNLASLDFVMPTIVPGARVNLGYLWGVSENTDGSHNKTS